MQKMTYMALTQNPTDIRRLGSRKLKLVSPKDSLSLSDHVCFWLCSKILKTERFGIASVASTWSYFFQQLSRFFLNGKELCSNARKERHIDQKLHFAISFAWMELLRILFHVKKLSSTKYLLHDLQPSGAIFRKPVRSAIQCIWPATFDQAEFTLFSM